MICIGLFLAFDAYHRAYGALLLEYKMLARVPPAVQGIVVLVE